MKKAMIPVLSALLIASMFTGCRRNVPAESTHNTGNTTHATTHATTHPTETTRHTEPSRHTEPTHATTMPHVPTEGATNGTDATGRARVIPPRY